MQLILIRHAQSERNVSKAVHIGLDSKLTKTGGKQARGLSRYLRTCDLKGFTGFVSPYLRCLQTANMIRDETSVSFKVHGSVREYHVKKNRSPLLENGGMTVLNRRNEFSNFDWSSFGTANLFYQNESINAFVDRVDSFLKSLSCEKCIIVSHGAPTKLLHDLSLGLDLREEYREQDLKQRPIEKKGGITNCSVTHIVDGVCKVFSTYLGKKSPKLEIS